ncbi:diguanylate cyclase [Vibrio sp. S9_S30]|uniref:sensor domain-containing diguanylate cyclase n=1 Tax=Vibrio sp. S9_S30 TaxID=2720226 RepID=UPI00168142F5|nr:diguanylate cyclase [Vibrio sp. S9_S30]MBD1557087.1 diguanylate cyclase [Vibrio sp. S9_S30]
MLVRLTRIQALLVIFTACFGSLGSWFAYSIAATVEKQNVETSLYEIAYTQALKAQYLLDDVLGLLESYGALFSASEQVSRNEFARFSDVMLRTQYNILAIQWAPKVHHSERSLVEYNLQQEGYAPSGFFTTNSNASETFPISTGPVYFPITFAEPLQPNKEAIGLEVTQRPFNQQVIRQSALDKRVQATSPFPIFQDPEGPLATAIYFPVFEEHERYNAIDEKHFPPDDLKGYVIMLLKPERLLLGNLANREHIHFILNDVTRESHHRIFPQYIEESDEHLSYSFPLTLPGRTWQLNIQFTQAMPILWIPYLVLFAFSALTFVILSAMVYSFYKTSVISDANEQLRRQKEVLQDLAMKDPLTGLVNRLSLQQQVTSLDLEENQLSALCLLDLDNFKHINDRFGHQQGDKFLKKIAKVISEHFDGIGITSRLGGDEFVFMLTELDSNHQVDKILQDLLIKIEHACSCGEHRCDEYPVSASIGVVRTRGKINEFEQVLNQADNAMYMAKRNGKNQFYVYSEI